MAESLQQIFAFFDKGGLVMWLLLGCSIIAAGVIIERLAYHWAIRFDPEKFKAELRQILEQQGAEAAQQFCAGNRHPVAVVARTYLSTTHHPPALARDLLAREGTEALALVERRLRILATIAQISPLLGLLGTVAGMVQAFAQIEALEGSVAPGQLAGGIWEALLTTLAGLSVAIPCIAMLQYFHSRTTTISHEMESMIISLDEWTGKTEESQQPS